MRFLLFALSLLAAPLSASQGALAQASDPLPEEEPAMRAEVGVESSRMRSPVTAGLLSAGNTFLPIILAASLLDSGKTRNHELGGWLLAYGVFVGPSVGHFYGGTGRGTTGVLLRVGGFAAATTGLVWALEDVFGGGPQRNEGVIGALLIGGLGVIFVSGIADIAMAPSATRRANERRLRRHRARLGPTAHALPGATQPGLALALRF